MVSSLVIAPIEEALGALSAYLETYRNKLLGADGFNPGPNLFAPVRGAILDVFADIGVEVAGDRGFN